MDPSLMAVQLYNTLFTSGFVDDVTFGLPVPVPILSLRPVLENF